MTNKLHAIEWWKDVPGYEGIYQVSNIGRVKGLDRYEICRGGKRFRKGRILKTRVQEGYVTVNLMKNSKAWHPGVYKLVAMAFIPNPNNQPVVNHKDENKKNNTVENLEWCSIAYNNSYGTHGTLNKKKVVAINLTTGEKLYFNSFRDAEREGGFNHSNISRVVNGIQDSCGGWTFKLEGDDSDEQ